MNGWPEGEEVKIELVEDDVLGIMFRADELPLKQAISLEDGKDASIEIDQTGITFTVDGESRTLTSNEFYDILKRVENGNV